MAFFIGYKISKKIQKKYLILFLNKFLIINKLNNLLLLYIMRIVYFSVIRYYLWNKLKDFVSIMSKLSHFYIGKDFLLNLFAITIEASKTNSDLLSLYNDTKKATIQVTESMNNEKI